MAKIKLICDKIIKYRAERIIQEDDFPRFLEKIDLCEIILENLKNFKQKEIQIFLQKSIITYLVTILESFFKFYFEKLIKEGEVPLEALAKEINKSIKMEDLVHFQTRDVHISELLAEFLNFQNLSDIDKIFRTLLKLTNSLYDQLKVIFEENKNFDLEEKIEMYPKLQKIIKMRHGIVHDLFFRVNITKSELSEDVIFIKKFLFCFSQFIAEKMKEMNNERGYMYLGFLKWHLEDFEGAVKCFEICNKLDPKFPGYLYSLGMLHYELNNNHESIKFFKAFVEKEPKDFLAWYNLGQSLYLVENYPESLEAFFNALELKPNDVESLNGVALDYYHLEDYKNGLRFVKQALEIDNDNRISLWLSGNLYSTMEKYEKALNAFNRGLEIEPYDICFLCMKGRTLLELNKVEEGITLLENLRSRETPNLCLYKYLAMAYQWKGEPSKALSTLEEGIELAKAENDQTECSKMQELLLKFKEEPTEKEN